MLDLTRVIYPTKKGKKTIDLVIWQSILESASGHENSKKRITIQFCCECSINQSSIYGKLFIAFCPAVYTL